MHSLFRRFLADRSAASAIEYGLIAGLIACALVGTLQIMTGKLNANFDKLAAAMR